MQRVVILALGRCLCFGYFDSTRASWFGTLGDDCFKEGRRRRACSDSSKSP